MKETFFLHLRHDICFAIDADSKDEAVQIYNKMDQDDLQEEGYGYDSNDYWSKELDFEEEEGSYVEGYDESKIYKALAAITLNKLAIEELNILSEDDWKAIYIAISNC